MKTFKLIFLSVLHTSLFFLLVKYVLYPALISIDNKNPNMAVVLFITFLILGLFLYCWGLLFIFAKIYKEAPIIKVQKEDISGLNESIDMEIYEWMKKNSKDFSYYAKDPKNNDDEYWQYINDET